MACQEETGRYKTAHSAADDGVPGTYWHHSLGSASSCTHNM